jgi:hypothetical protein
MSKKRAVCVFFCEMSIDPIHCAVHPGERLQAAAGVHDRHVHLQLQVHGLPDPGVDGFECLRSCDV